MSWLRHGYGENASDINITTGTSWTDVATFTVNADANYKLVLQAHWSATVAVAAGDFRITVNGTQVADGPAPVGAATGNLAYQVSVASSADHVVKLQARRSGTVLATLAVVTGGGKIVGYVCNT